MNISAELISIGNELLSGRTLNTHGRDLGAALAAIGLQLARDTTIPDDIPTIVNAVKEALGRVDLVFASGGLGPTVDDITRDALGRLLERKIVLHHPTVSHLKGWYLKRGRTITDPGKTELREIAQPVPAKGEVLLQVRLVGLCGVPRTLAILENGGSE